MSRFDGKGWTTFTTGDGLVHDIVYSIFADREGNMWFGTLNWGVSRFDGEGWTSFSVTEMESYFDEMEQLGEEHRGLAEHLRGLRKQHDIDAILEIIQEVKHE